jgi:hypothetical protein
MIELFFHDRTDCFFANGILQEEPEESLEELLTLYKRSCEEYDTLVRKMVQAARPYTFFQWIGDMEPRFMEDSVRNYGHRTWLNAAWSDITLALATDFSSPGELTTRKAAGKKHIAYQIPGNLEDILLSQATRRREADRIVTSVSAHQNCRKGGIRLNIAGNGLATLAKSGIGTETVTAFLREVFMRCREQGVTILEVRSGGQSGVDEAGIKAAQQCGLKCSVLAPKGYRMRDRDGHELEGKARFLRRFKNEVIDYDAWMKAHGDESFAYGLAEHNSFGGIEFLEWEIDLKIMHLNEKEKKNGIDPK